MKYLTLVWAGLWRKPARTLYTLLSVVVAFVLFGLLQGVTSMFAQAIQNQKLDRLFIDARFPGSPIPLTHRDQIARVAGIKLLTQVSFMGGFYQEQTNFLNAVNTNVDIWLAIRPEWKHSKEDLDAVLRTRTGVMLSDAVAKRNNWKVGDKFTMRTQLMKRDGNSDWTFDVVGIMTNPEQPEARIFLANWDYLNEARVAGTGTVSRFLMRIDDPRRSTQISREVDALFANSPTPTRTQSEQAVAQSQISNIGDINFFTRAIMAAVFFSLLLLTANTMMESVRERTAEFGVLKTLGFTGTTILALVLTEAVALFVTAAAAGLAVAATLFPLLRDYFGEVTLPISVVYLGLALAVAAAFLSAGIPAWRAKRLDVVAALATR